MKKLHKPQLCRPTVTFLRATLPVLLLISVGLLISYLCVREENLLLANLCYPPMLECVTASLAVLAVGAILIELVQREQDSL